MLIAVFQCGRDGGGAADRCGDPTGAIPVELPPLVDVDVEVELVPKPVDVAVVETGGAVATTTGREVRSIVFATRSRWRTDPRGTPKPAEPGFMVRRRGAPAAGFAARPRPTITVCRPRTGGVGTFVLTGGFTTCGMPYHGFQ